MNVMVQKCLLSNKFQNHVSSLKFTSEHIIYMLIGSCSSILPKFMQTSQEENIFEEEVYNNEENIEELIILMNIYLLLIGVLAFVLQERY